MDGAERMGTRICSLVARLRSGRGRGPQGARRSLGRRVHRPVGLAASQQANRRARRGQRPDERARDPARRRIRRRSAVAGMHDQGQHEPQRRVHLSRAWRSLVRERQYGLEQGQAMVLHGPGGGSCRMPTRWGKARRRMIYRPSDDLPRAIASARATWSAPSLAALFRPKHGGTLPLHRPLWPRGRCQFASCPG